MIIAGSLYQAEGNHQASADFERRVAGRPNHFLRFLIDGKRADTSGLKHFAEHRRQVGLSEHRQHVGELPGIGRGHLPPARVIITVEKTGSDILSEGSPSSFRDKAVPFSLGQPYGKWPCWFSVYRSYALNDGRA
ncbi:hypothetical protein J2Y55_004615 [Bosea sp. BE125]|uniref:hypothetical protein n=1 Tax=Bosea sp. BE125 TaxID=2817909 RepID=UPI0028587DC4|nr:hypothetical protein [Bosea sp. BE125]MDR6873588.1 hypothetical protein [Bosea sp. BE125]